jgi:phosphoesterase RecJ-like protein
MEDKDIIQFIKRSIRNKEPLNVSHVKSVHPSIFYNSKKIFGSWKKAIEMANIDYTKITKRARWTEENVIEELKNLSEENLIDKNLRKNYSKLYNACIKLFGSRKNALIAAGINYEDTLMNVPWTRDRVISSIQMYHLNSIPLNFKFISMHHTKLRKTAEKFFGSWGDAISAAGLDYEAVKKNKGWCKPFLSEDGVLYTSHTEGLVANELYELKSEGKILNYEVQQTIATDHKWTCDFLITLINTSQLWLEVEETGKDTEEFKDKVKYYEKANLFYYKISSESNVKNIIERFTNWYTIPIKNCIITSHKNPDGDALSSMIVLYQHILNNGGKVVIKIGGSIPKNLLWMLEGIEVVKKVPDWAEMIFILDCAPIKERLGWELPHLPIYNIDHHSSRLEENDPDNSIHVIKACSTAALLFTRFGIRNNLLVVGIYTDTLFTKQVYEVLHLLNKIDVEEEELNTYISRINVSSDKKLWDLVQTAKTHRCRNGFMIVETESNFGPDVIENFMQILMKLNESVCFIYGKERSVKLRTSNPELDVSQIASEYEGGGHPYAAMCRISSKISEFKNRITTLNITKPKDGYGKE